VRASKNARTKRGGDGKEGQELLFQATEARTSHLRGSGIWLTSRRPKTEGRGGTEKDEGGGRGDSCSVSLTKLIKNR